MNESLLLNIDVRLNLKISYLEGQSHFSLISRVKEELCLIRHDRRIVIFINVLIPTQWAPSLFCTLLRFLVYLSNQNNFETNLNFYFHFNVTMVFTASLFYNRWMNMDKKIPEKELLNFYTTCISPILEYASPVFHNALPKYLEIEKLQRRALTIIYPWWPDSDALKQSGLSRLSERRQHLTSKLFSETTQDPTNSLRSLLLPENNCRYQFRRKRTFIAPRTKPIG